MLSLAPLSVNVPVPAFVKPPPAPAITPAKAVAAALLPPVVNVLAPRFTPVTAVPLSEPIVSLASSDKIPVPVNVSADPSGIAVPPCTCSVPALIAVPPL